MLPGVAEEFLLPPGAVLGTVFSLNIFLPNRVADRLFGAEGCGFLPHHMLLAPEF